MWQDHKRRHGETIRGDVMRLDDRIRGETRGYEARHVIYKVQVGNSVYDLSILLHFAYMSCFAFFCILFKNL